MEPLTQLLKNLAKDRQGRIAGVSTRKEFFKHRDLLKVGATISALSMLRIRIMWSQSGCDHL